MSKPLSVDQLRAALDKMSAEGHGSLPVMKASNPAKRPKLVNKEPRYIGPSEWDSSTYTFGSEGSGWHVSI